MTFCCGGFGWQPSYDKQLAQGVGSPQLLNQPLENYFRPPSAASLKSADTRTSIDRDLYDYWMVSLVFSDNYGFKLLTWYSFHLESFSVSCFNLNICIIISVFWFKSRSVLSNEFTHIVARDHLILTLKVDEDWYYFHLIVTPHYKCKI